MLLQPRRTLLPMMPVQQTPLKRQPPQFRALRILPQMQLRQKAQWMRPLMQSQRPIRPLR